MTQAALAFDDTLAVKFAEFDANHPEVYRLLVSMARRIRQRGFEHYSIKTIVEVARWSRDLRRDSSEPFLINNSYSSFYARKIMAENPDLVGLFELRRQSRAA